MPTSKKSPDLQKEILSNLGSLDPGERDAAVGILKSVVDGDTTSYNALWEADYEIRPPTIEEFLDSDEYLGALGEDVWDVWRHDLIKIFKPGSDVWEWILQGALGVGKTTAAVIAILYKGVHLVCLRDPQKAHGLMKGMPIVFGLFNVYKQLAEDVAFEYIDNAMQICPFFKEHGIKNRNGHVVGFPKNIQLALGAQTVHVLGKNVYGGLMDEGNFGKKVSQTSADMSQMQHLYTQTRDRIASRFLTSRGKNPGFLCLISSKRDQTDFLEEHVEKVQGNEGVYISDYSLWRAKPQLCSGKWFSVFAGDETKEPKILEDDSDLSTMEESRIIQVPDTVYMRDRFAYNLPDAIRNIAGVSTCGAFKFIFNREIYWAKQKNVFDRKHPFKVRTATIGIDKDTSLVDYLDREVLLLLVDKSNDIWEPRYHKHAPRVLHIDLSKNNDRTGMSMGCISGYDHVIKQDADGHKFKNVEINVFMDFMLEIKATQGSRIDYEKLREFVFFLRDNGFNIVLVTLDQYQSEDTMQIFIKSGMESKLLSVDRTKTHYYMLRSCILQGRFDMYDYPIFHNQMLELDEFNDKVEHPSGGAKDISDSAAGVVSGLMTHKFTEIKQGEISPRHVFGGDDNTKMKADPNNLDDMFED